MGLLREQPASRPGCHDARIIRAAAVFRHEKKTKHRVRTPGYELPARVDDVNDFASGRVSLHPGNSASIHQRVSLPEVQV